MAVDRNIAGDWTYSGDPAHCDLCWVWNRIGDTDRKDPLTSESQVRSALSSEGNTRGAAAALCEELSLYFSRQVTESSSVQGGMTQSKQYGERAERYKNLGILLRSQASVIAPAYAGGISVSDKQAQEADTDRTTNSFTRTTMEPDTSSEAA